MNSNIDFVNTNTTKALLKMFFPLMMAMILTMAYSMVDSLWVGNLLGKAGLSALTASTAVVLIINSLSMGIGNGVSVMMDSFLISHILACGLALLILHSKQLNQTDRICRAAKSTSLRG